MPRVRSESELCPGSLSFLVCHDQARARARVRPARLACTRLSPCLSPCLFAPLLVTAHESSSHLVGIRFATPVPHALPRGRGHTGRPSGTLRVSSGPLPASQPRTGDRTPSYREFGLPFNHQSSYLRVALPRAPAACRGSQGGARCAPRSLRALPLHHAPDTPHVDVDTSLACACTCFGSTSLRRH